MAAPFVAGPRPRRSLLARLLHRPPSGVALADVTNALAGAASVRDVGEDTLAAIAEAHRINLHAHLGTAFVSLYEAFVEHCLADRVLTGEEIEDTEHLRILFGIPAVRAAAIHEQIAVRQYEQPLGEAMADGRLSDEERAFLADLAVSLQLPEATANRARDRAAEVRLAQWAEAHTADHRVGPDEYAELQAIAASLGVAIVMDEASSAALDRMRLFWVIENDEVPTIEPDINLPRTERCYFTTEVRWHERRRVTEGFRYAGPTARVRLAKGIYFRAGEFRTQPVSSEELKLIDAGTIYLTNKRLIFRGARGNKSIRLERVLTFEAFRDGVSIQKDAGKSPFLAFDEDIDLFAVILDRAIRDAVV